MTFLVYCCKDRLASPRSGRNSAGKQELLLVKRKNEQDGNVPSRRHILGSKIFKEQLLEKFGKIFFFKKNFFDFFFEKKYFLGRTMPKNSKRGHSGSFNVFYKPKTSKKFKGVPFDKFRKFSRKSRTVPKKIQRGDPLGTSGCVCFLEKVKTERGTLWSKVCLLRRIAEL